MDKVLDKVFKSLPVDAERLRGERLTGDLTSAQVAAFFRRRCANLEPHMYDFPPTWGAAATETIAIVSLEGDVPETKASTEDAEWPQNTYQWFDVEEVPVGGYLARISATGTLWAFHRRVGGYWEAYASPDFAS
jgi:hypothetical protein